LLGVSALANLHAYFSRWASAPATHQAYDEGLYWIAQQLAAAPPETALYETPVGREWLTFEFGLGPERFEDFRDFNGRECLVLPALPAGGARYAVVTAEDTASLPALQAAFPGGRLLAEYALGGTPYAAIFDVPPGSAAQVTPAHELQADFAVALRLRGYTLESDALSPGTDLRLTVTWELRQPTPADLHTFVHVLGPIRADGSPLYAQSDSGPCDNAYPTWQWAAGELLVDRLAVPVPADTPPGQYRLNVGWYDSATLQRLEVFDPAGEPLGDSLELHAIDITAP
jgi:hypothetical protein